MSRKKKIILPCLRGEVGDWVYYVTLMTFDQVANRVSMVPEIYKNEELRRLIQREITNRTSGIVEYIKTQELRFFNSLVLGIYGGHPKWHELQIEENQFGKDFEFGENAEKLSLDEDEENYLSSSLGVLILDGYEKIFAIDGQHRTNAIKDTVADRKDLKQEEIPAIFISHKKNEEGEKRTRHLLSTLNRYAKPVSKSEIIAIDEEDNCAIITRGIIENFSLLDNIVLFNKNKSISTSNTTDFTNIILIYDWAVAFFTDKSLFDVSTKGYDNKMFTHRRIEENELLIEQSRFETLITEVFDQIPSLKAFRSSAVVDRRDDSTSLLFKPIGQIILFSTLKIAIDKGKKDEVINFFRKDDFNLNHPVWRKVFRNPETGNMQTDKAHQKYAFQLILLKAGIKIQLTDKDKKIHEKYSVETDEI